MSGAQKPRLADSLRGLLDAGLHTVQTRLELLTVEAQEEKLRIISLLLNAIFAAIFLGFGIVFLALFLTVLLWDEHRLAALGVATAFLTGAGLFAARNAAREFRRGSGLFSGSLAELTRDRDSLRREE